MVFIFLFKIKAQKSTFPDSYKRVTAQQAPFSFLFFSLSVFLSVRILSDLQEAFNVFLIHQTTQ